MLSVWLYAYALGITSAAAGGAAAGGGFGFPLLGGGERVDNWALSAFRRRHGRGLNDVFTQVLETARELGLARLGRVAIDSTRIQAQACRDRLDTEQKLRHERVKLRRQVRRWQKACDNDDQEAGGLQLAIAAEQRLAEMPRRLEKLRKSGLQKLSRTDEEARFLRTRSGLILGYTAEMAVTDDHFIVAQRVTQAATDNASSPAMVQQVEQQCGAPPLRVIADSGYFWLQKFTGQRARGPGGKPVRTPHLRRKLRSPVGRQIYARRKTLVEPVFGVLKQQREMRQFRTRGMSKVGVEFTLATLTT
jgi:hypothetical protein